MPLSLRKLWCHERKQLRHGDRIAGADVYCTSIFNLRHEGEDDPAESIRHTAHDLRCPASFLERTATWFYLFGGIAAAFFNIAQKKLVDSMDIISMNVSMFIYGALVCLCTIPFTMPAMTGSFGPLPAIGILTLGCCTGIGFLLQALAMRSVSVLIATVIQSSMSILSIFWSAVLYHDNVSIYAVIGTCIFVVGILLQIKGDNPEIYLQREKRACE